MTSLQLESGLSHQHGDSASESHRHGEALVEVSGRKVKVPVELVNNHTIALTVLICQWLLFLM